MRLPIDTGSVTLVAGKVEAVMDFETKRPKADSNGEPIYSIDLVALGPDGAQIWPVKVSGEPKGVVAVIELRDEVGFFNRLAAEVRKISKPDAQASQAAEQAVRQFMSEGLAAGDVVDVFGIADKDRPEISVLSDEFLDSIVGRTEHRNIQIRLLEKLLNDEIRSRMSSNRIQAKVFGDQVVEVLHRYELRQLTSAEVVERLVEIARRLRDARRRHEQLGLTEEEAAFYDALAGGIEHVTADPALAAVAHELVESLRQDLSVDWTRREDAEARIRAKIKRLLRRHRDALAKPETEGGGAGPRPDLNYYTSLVLDQARAIYRYWPEVGDRLFDERA